MLETLDYTIRIGSTPTFLYLFSYRSISDVLQQIADTNIQFNLLAQNVLCKKCQHQQVCRLHSRYITPTAYDNGSD